MLERYGHSVETYFGPAGRFMAYPVDHHTESTQRNQMAQPFFSVGLFAWQILTLPYALVVDPPWEAQYDLGTGVPAIGSPRISTTSRSTARVLPGVVDSIERSTRPSQPVVLGFTSQADKGSDHGALVIRPLKGERSATSANLRSQRHLLLKAVVNFSSIGSV